MSSSLFERRLNERVATGFGGPLYGVYVALVTDLNDPTSEGRVKIKLPWQSGDYAVWARMATLFAGNNRGSWFIPDVNDEVLVAFEAGDPDHPVVIGGLWNGSDASPASMDSAGQNNLKVIRSRNGVQITLDDENGRERCVVETPGGQKITLQDGPGQVELVDSNGNSIKMESSGITVNAAARLTITASTIEVNAGQVTVNAGMSRFSGVVNADTVITNSVVSASYTPGAGNIW